MLAVILLPEKKQALVKSSVYALFNTTLLLFICIMYIFSICLVMPKMFLTPYDYVMNKIFLIALSLPF